MVAVGTEELDGATPEERGTLPQGAGPVDTVESGLIEGSSDSLPSSAHGITEDHELVVYRAPEDAPSGNLEWLESEEGEIVPGNFLRAPDGVLIGALDVREEEDSFFPGAQRVLTSSFEEIHTFTLSSEGEVQDESPMFENSGTSMSHMWIDEAGSRLVMEANGFLYQTPLDAPDEPTELFGEFGLTLTEDDYDSQFEVPHRTNMGIYPVFEG